MSLIPEQYQKCKEKERYFYFADTLPGLFLDVEKNVVVHSVDQAELKKIKDAIYQVLISGLFEKYREQVQSMAKGNEKTELARAKEYIEEHSVKDSRGKT